MRKYYQNYRIDESDQEVVILYYFGDEESVIVPNEIHGKPVTAIADEAFLSAGNPFLRDVSRKICRKSLKHIKLPSTLKHLNNALIYCLELETIRIPASLETISNRCFTQCRKLRQIDVDDKNRFYSSRDGVLYSRDGKRLIQFPMRKKTVPSDVLDGVTVIGNQAFSNCEALTEIVIPESVQSIEYSAFCNCSMLETVQMHPNIVLNGSGHFSNCVRLSDIMFFNSEPVVPYGCFSNCKALRKINFGSTIKTIAEHAFGGSGLQEIAIPDKTKKILSGAFCQRLDLKKVIIPKTVSYISNSAVFSGCGIAETDEDPVYYGRGHDRDAACTFYVHPDSAGEKYCIENNYIYTTGTDL